MRPAVFTLHWFNPFYGLNQWQTAPVNSIAEAYKWVRFVEKATGRPARFAIYNGSWGPA